MELLWSISLSLDPRWTKLNSTAGHQAPFSFLEAPWKTPFAIVAFLLTMNAAGAFSIHPELKCGTCSNFSSENFRETYESYEKVNQRHLPIVAIDDTAEANINDFIKTLNTSDVDVQTSVSQPADNERLKKFDVKPDSQTRTNTCPPTYLIGNLELSESLAAVPEQLTPGHKYLDGGADFFKTSERWFRIPVLLAGTWQASAETTISESPKTSLHLPIEKLWVTSCSWGDEIDTNRDIWCRRVLPEKAGGAGNLYSVESLVDKEELEVKEDYLILKTHEFTSTLNPSRVITSTGQIETVRHYKPLSNGMLVEKTICRVFDQFGTKKRTLTQIKRFSKLSDFAPKRDKKVIASFRAYLISNGMKSLIPTDLGDNQ